MTGTSTQQEQPLRATPSGAGRRRILQPLLVLCIWVALPAAACATTVTTLEQKNSALLGRAIEEYLADGHDVALLSEQTLEHFLSQKQGGGELGPSLWKRFHLLPPVSVMDSESGRRMLAITSHEISNGWFASPGRYVIWLNDSSPPPESGSRVWSEWQPEAAVTALFKRNGAPLPHAGVWHSPGGSILSSGRLHELLGLVVIPLVVAGAFAFSICRRRMQNVSRARQASHGQLRRSLTAVVEQAQAFLTAADAAEAREFIHHGEFGAALELICTQLEEHGASIPVSLLSRIQHVGARMQLPSSTWEGFTVASTAANPSPP